MSLGDGGRTGLEVAVIGLAGRFPGARDVEELWRNLREGVESIRFFSRAELLAAGVAPELLEHPGYVPARAPLDEPDLFDAGLFGLNPREAEMLDPQHRLLLECAWESLERAGHAPECFAGPIGVYAGVGQSWYFLSQLYSNSELLGAFGLFPAMLGNSGDFLTSRLSYKLGLGGPSVNVQTACSTSLVAVHLACQGLLAGECDMALAGGVSVRFPQVAGYLYQEGGIASPDGHTRAFDARAGGTVSGDGVGLVVLRRLADALADGDHVHAVIRGSAVNNDGSYRVGFTAPSVAGQVQVIRTALAAAAVPPATITYVEAHGAATPLGDPTEVAALQEAFGDGAGASGHRCALGSIKTNLGHLDTAAGVAGLIKTVLALERGELPASLHFEQPNPQIAFDRGPFYVNAATRPWESDGGPRRAGVSSFGMGGTNAHVVLEEAPAPDESEPSGTPQLLALSAQTETALDAALDRLARHLDERPDLRLPDVAFTLQTGRRPLRHRALAVVSDAGEAVEALRDRDPRRLWTGVAAGERRVAFLLAGVGGQAAGMGRELYRAAPTFRHHADRCCDLLAPSLGLDLRTLLDWRAEPGRPADGGRTAASQVDLRRMLGRDRPAAGDARLLDRTLYSQPAVFVLGYALARQWKEWGVHPQALLGYSLGEYLAACLAGVLELEDALELVAERARLIEELPAGAMLAVPLSAEELAARLAPEVSLAAGNAPLLSVAAGPPAAIEELARQLAVEGLPSRRLATSHAFHSRMMEPIAGRFAAALAGRRLRPPEVPYVSNVTGTWIRPEEATDPDHWVRHLCGTVRFSEGVRTLLAEPGSLLLELGPGRDLSTFVRQHPDPDAGRLALTSLPPADEGGSDLAHLLSSLGRLWLGGAAVDWRGLHRHERRRRVQLPTYPFERRRYFVDGPGGLPGAAERPPRTPDAPAPQPAGEARPPRPHLQSAYAAPTDEVEGAIVEVWQELLGIGQVGIDDDFFELGGHSLLATQTAARLRERLAVELPLRAFTDAPTPARLAAVVRELRRAGPLAAPAALPTIVPDPDRLHEPFPLTDVQQAYWIGRSPALQLGNVATHAYFEMDVPDLDLERYERAWQRLIDRHGILRAVFPREGEQVILAEVPPFRIPVLDLRGRPAEEADRELAAVRARMSHQVLPADRWPLFEIRAARFDGGVRLHVSLDFLILDAWSLEIVRKELKLLYERPDAELPALEISFRDYVLAALSLRQTDLYRRSRQYWLDRLPTLAPAPELPLARDPASIAKPRFTGRTATLDREAWNRLKQRARRLGVTSTGLLIAAFSEVLARWSRSPRFTLNLTLFNRLPLHPQVNELLGDFSSLGLLEVDAAGGDFAARARRLQIQLWDDLDHRSFSGVQVVRELGRVRGSLTAALMPVVVTSTLSLVEEEPDVPQERGGFRITQTPQVWMDHQITEIAGRLTFNWDVVEELFPAGLIDAMFAAYRGLLRTLADDDGAWSRPSPLALPDGELAARRAANDTAAPLPLQLLHEPFLERAGERPETPALIAPGRTVTYGELRRAALRLARRLREEGVEPDTLVAVVADKGWEQAAAVLGILQAGAAYLPIDPGLPAARRQHLLAHGKARWALTQPGLAADEAWPDGVRTLPVTAELLAPGEEPPLASLQTPGDLAYVIYTSGSTGLPKGVMIEHRSAQNTVHDIGERFAVGPGDRVLALSDLGFDLSVFDLFGLLGAGGAVVLPPPAARRDPAVWAELIRAHGVTVWNSVPALLQLLVDHAAADPAVRLDSLRLILLSGDWIPVSLPDRVRALAPEARVISLGGATEAAIWSIAYPVAGVDPAWASIPYGRPLANQRFHVLNGALEDCPTWVPGELHIAGAGLARGYWRDAERTAAGFFRHPETGERLYRTGDLGRYLPDGTLEFLGREDLQVKIQGYRIELGEIEAALLQHPEVAAAAVAALGEHGTRRLAAFVVPHPGAAPDPAGLREHLGPILPAYMLPATFTRLAALPLSANGKVDRRALTLPEGPAARAVPDARPATASLAQQVQSEVAAVLRAERVERRSSFLDLGITSIEIIQLAGRLKSAFGLQPDVEQLFTMNGVEALIAFYEERADRIAAPGAPAAAEPPAPAAPGSGGAPAPAERYTVLLDEEERQRFKAGRPGLRRLAGEATVDLPRLDPPDGLRQSTRQFAPQPVTLEQIGRLLGALRDLGDDGEPRHRYGSAGGLYPVQVYLHARPGRFAGLPAGVYYYHPAGHRLAVITPDADLPRNAHGWLHWTMFDQCAFSLFLVAQLDAIGPLYGGRNGEDYCRIEAGLISQLLETAAPACGLGLCQIGIGGVDFAAVRPLFALDEGHLCVHSLLGGPLDPALGPAARAAAPLLQEWEEGEL